MQELKDELVGWAYVRVSTADQRNVLHGSVEQQLNRIKRWQSEQTLRTGIPHRITRYIDEDISGRVESLHKRTEYHDLIRAIKNRLIDFVVIEKLDRLHRNQIESRKFIDLCDSMGVKFYRLDGGLVDLKDRGSRTSVFIESWMAEEYSMDLVEKLTKKGREARVNNGKDNNSMPVLGLDEHPTEACFYNINKEEQKIVTDIFRHFCATGDLQQTVIYCEKKGYRTKERHTRPNVKKGKKTPSRLVGGISFDRKSLRALLVSRKIAGFGFFKDDWNQFPNLQDDNGMVRWQFRHGPVISTELFEKAQSILRNNAKYYHRIYQDQRIYFLSGILFDRDGNKLRGESANKKSNVYYINPTKKYRIDADKIENTVVDFVGSLLKDNGLLDKAINNFFHGSNSGIKKLEEQISHNQTEIKQCDRLLEMLGKNERDKLLANPDKMEELLFEGIEVRKQTKARLDELRNESKALEIQKQQVSKLKDKTDVQNHIKKALNTFKASSSKRKQRLIQILVPKLIIDEKENQLYLFVNPLMKNSCKDSIRRFDNFEEVLPERLIQSENDSYLQVREPSLEIVSHGGKFLRVADEWRDVRALCEHFFLRPKFHVVSPFYVNPLFKNKFFLQQKYAIEGLSARQIAQEIFSSKMAVLAALNRFNIPIREPHYNHGHPSQLRYGQKYKKRRLSPEKKEQNVIRLVKELHGKGLSLRHIARILNDIKIATKNRGKRWHQEMVRRILLNSNSTDN